MGQLFMTWFSGVFAGVAMIADDPMVQFQSGMVAGFFYLLAWVMSHD